jgi:hypothetical protein
MPDPDNMQALIETMTAWRAVRDSHPQGSKGYVEADAEFKKAEAEYYKHRK